MSWISSGRDSSEEAMDYSLLVACFAGGITAICILVVGVTLTLYRRSHPLQPSKMQTHVVHYVDDQASPSAARHEDRQRGQPHHQVQTQLGPHLVSCNRTFIRFHSLLLHAGH
jgi:hypothetical protein